MAQVFLTKLLRCTDISNDYTIFILMEKIMIGEDLTEEEVLLLDSIEEEAIKDGIITSGISLIGPSNIESLDDLVGNMLMINEDGTFRYADDYDISLIFNIPMFDGIPCEHELSNIGIEDLKEI